MDTAVDLLRKKNYQEAAHILRQYPDDPTAKNWLDTLHQSIDYHAKNERKSKLPVKRTFTRGNWGIHLAIAIFWGILNPFAGIAYIAFQLLFNRTGKTDVRHIVIGVVFAFGAGGLISSILLYGL